MREFNMHVRDGFALPAALLAMIVIGAIVTGGFYMSSQAQSVSISTDLGAQAMHVAEYGLQAQFANLTTGDLSELYPDSVTRVQSTTVSDGGTELGTYQIRVMPLGDRLYMVESEGRVQRGQQVAVRRVAALARTSQAEVPYKGALSVIGKFNREGASRVHGEDGCYPGDGSYSEAGVTALHEDSVTGLLHGKQEAITGDPAVKAEPGMTQELMSEFGDIDLDELIASATLRYPNASSGTSPRNMGPASVTDPSGNVLCDRDAASPENWGEPYPEGTSGYVGACANHYPIIHSAGNMDLTTGRGQGILIVEGDLEINGNFEFDGVVIVTGKFTMRGTGGAEGKIQGSVIVQGEGTVEDDPNKTSGNALVQWNSCAVEKALESNLRIRPLERSWMSDPPRLPTYGT
jgi:hypothetical protein